ncbi:hypothetical protein NQ317_008538 [Molorchus minor]|uniref:cellulase n=1 Tax=Molorchus minor TaxID=1323400 RepID=A0ABQ9J2V4_9CUCU|nr:hypothetical protein NQ317_008538 [Molorchus minor]
MKIEVFVVVALTVFLATIPSFSADDIIAEPIEGGLTGTGYATRMWDCCKPACAWRSVAYIDPPVRSCEADGSTTSSSIFDTSGCEDGGTSFICNDQHSWVVNSTFALGFAGTPLDDGNGVDNKLCCSCFLLQYTGSQHKQFIVQIINGGSDYSEHQFDLVIPGGGVGAFPNGCTRQWGAPVGGWGEQYGGVTSEAGCDDLPEALQEYCHFRFQFLEDVSNLNITFTQVKCPTQLTDITGCFWGED